MTLTDLLTRAEEIAGRATPGPWHRCRARNPDECVCGLVWHNSEDFLIGRAHPTANATFVEAARTLIGPLLEVARAANNLPRESHPTGQERDIYSALARLAEVTIP